METLTSRQRIGMHDITFKHIIDWGLGFIVNSAHYGEAIPYGFGNRASLRAFGHGGSQSSVAMADPEYGVAIVVIFNGMPGEDAHQRRMRATLEAVYEDLGIGGKKPKPEIRITNQARITKSETKTVSIIRISVLIRHSDF